MPAKFPPPPGRDQVRTTIGFEELLKLSVRVIKLEEAAIEEARGPRVEPWMSLAVVAAAGALSGAGAGLLAMMGHGVVALVGFAVTVLILHVLASLLNGRGDIMDLLKALGLGYLVNAVGIVPLLGIVGQLWYVAVMVVTLRHCYTLSTERAIVVVLLPALMLLAGTILLALGLLSLSLLFGGW